MNLPNKLSLLRIALTPVLVLLLDKYYSIILGGIFHRRNILDLIIQLLIITLFIFLVFTDFIDGYLSRKYNLITNFGKLIDPIADKIFVFAILLVFLKYNILSLWLILIVLSREFVIMAVRTMIVENNGKIVPASFYGKLKTVTQFIAILFILLFPYNKNFNNILMIPSVILSIFSMYNYIISSKEYLK